MRKCYKCLVQKEMAEFSRDRRDVTGYKYICRICDNIHKQSSRYGVTPEQWKELTKAAECEICGSSKSLVVDHDHVTGLARGRLCRGCNGAIAILDNRERLQAAQNYLAKPPSTIKMRNRF